MGALFVSIEKNFCTECSLTLQRFILNIDGVKSVDIENCGGAIVFDESRIAAEILPGIAAVYALKLFI